MSIGRVNELMLMNTKPVHFLVGVIFLLSAFADSAGAASECCQTFGFPLVSVDTSTITFYSRKTGDLFRYDVSGSAAESLGRGLSLGASIKKIVWSPDGKRMLLLAENVPAAMQELRFLSQDRDIDSLNWWLYDPATDDAVLLDAGIVDAGWLPDGRIVYDWNDVELSVMDVSHPGTHVRLAALSGAGRKTDDALGVSTSTSRAVFPANNGIYDLGADGSTVRFFPTEAAVTGVAVNPFDPDRFLVSTASGPILFDATSGRLEKIDTTLSVRQSVFIGKTSAALLVADGKVYSHDIGTDSESMILNVSDPVDDIFGTGREGEFLFTSGEQVFKRVAGSSQPVELRNIAPVIETPDAAFPESAQDVSKSGNVFGIVLSVVAIVLLGIGSVIFVRRIRSTS